MEPPPLFEFTRLRLSDGRLTTFTPNAKNMRKTYLPAMFDKNSIVISFGQIHITADPDGKEFLILGQPEMEGKRITQIHGFELDFIVLHCQLHVNLI